MAGRPAPRGTYRPAICLWSLVVGHWLFRPGPVTFLTPPGPPRGILHLPAPPGGPAVPADRPTVLCVASSYPGDAFLVRCKQEGCGVVLLTAEKSLRAPWPRQAIDEVFALPHFQDRRMLVHAVAHLARTRPIRRIVALDDADVEAAAHLREHLRLPGVGEST